MSEESNLTKDETINNPIETTSANETTPNSGTDSVIPTATNQAQIETPPAAATKPSTPSPNAKKSTSDAKADDDTNFPDEDIPAKKRFHFKKEDKEFFRDKWILSRISDDNLMEYLALEQRRNELQQEAKDIKEKRILKAFEITVGLASIVAVIYLLRDNPTILVNILYIAGILTAFWFWKNPRDK